MKDSTEAVKLIDMTEEASERAVEQTADVSVLMTMEETVELMRSMPREQVRECIVEEIVDVSRVMEEFWCERVEGVEYAVDLIQRVIGSTRQLRESKEEH